MTQEAKPDRVLIFDTTLRDGEQSPGASLMPEEKLEIAAGLAELGVDIIEVGFPISSPGEFQSVSEIARTIQGPVIAGLARALRGDVERCWEAVKNAERGRIHTFIGTSSIHREEILKKSEEEVVAMAVEAVKIARDLTDDVEFSAMDASRTEMNYLCEVLEKCIDAGASTVNIPDTVGYAVPETFGDMIRKIFERVSNIEKTVVSIHCHNDLGLATINSIVAVKNGARQIECTINGVGERAGNASLEEVVMILKTRADVFGGTDTGINAKGLWPISRMVSHLMGVSVQPNKPIVGANAFAHSSGIHQDGILKEKTTFEIMTPESVGVPDTRIVLTSRSGRHALKTRLEELGYELDEEVFERAHARFKLVADKKKEVFDEDLQALLEDERGMVSGGYRLVSLYAVTGNKTVPTATVTLEKEGDTAEESSTGDGPVDACYRAIDLITGLSPSLEEYSLRAVTGGKEAMGEVSVRIELEGKTFSGRGASTDIVEASTKAYLRAVNKIIVAGGAG